MKLEAYDDLGYRAYTSLSESDKAINSLKGILMGISLDNEVTDTEMKELLGWSAKHHDLIDRNPFKNLMVTIQEAANEKANRMEMIEDLYWLCDRYSQDSKNVFYDLATADLQTLQGLCHGILADSVVSDVEVRSLEKWLEAHDHLNSYYPYDEIYSLLLSVLKDGVIDDVERKRLMAYFNEFVKLTDQELTQKIGDEISSIKISGICTSSPNLEFAGNAFCLTGIFSRSTRKEAENAIVDMGGIVNKDVSKKTDYLIIGDSGNPCWAFACYGRKVEKAITMRKDGSRVSLIHEYDFWDALEDARHSN
jgi:NAD-dependent DNA ligase